MVSRAALALWLLVACWGLSSRVAALQSYPQEALTPSGLRVWHYEIVDKLRHELNLSYDPTAEFLHYRDAWRMESPVQVSDSSELAEVSAGLHTVYELSNFDRALFKRAQRDALEDLHADDVWGLWRSTELTWLMQDRSGPAPDLRAAVSALDYDEDGSAGGC